MFKADDQLFIDEETSPVVRQIYNLFPSGYGPMQIARKLAERNIPTLRRAVFTPPDASRNERTPGNTGSQ